MIIVKKPKIRFKGFTETWEQRKLGTVATFINGRAYSQDELQSSGKYRVLRVGNLYTNYSWYYSDMELEDKYYAISGDLLYTWSATFGPHVWLGEKIIYHYHIWKVVLSSTLDKSFAVHLLERDKQEILSDKNGSTMVHITKKGMEEKEVILPTNIDEQIKIGKQLDAINNLITLHQRKCENLKKLKKFMLQKLFPQNGENVPKVRFSNFTDTWEQRKLGELADIIGGGTPSTSKDEYWDGDIDWYAPAEIADQIYVESSERKITEEGFNNSSVKMLPIGTVLFTSRAGIGKMAILRKESCTNQGFQSIVPHENELDSYFIFSRSEELKRYGETVGAGSTFVEVSGKQMANMDLMMPPTVEEQRQIGDYLEKIDTLITLHQSKCDKLKEVKKYMLQNMFI